MGSIKGQLTTIKAVLFKYHGLLILLLTPIILSPIVIVYQSPQSRTAYAIGIIAVYWVSEVIPLAVTSLLPLIIFPMLGVLKGKEVCLVYMKDVNVLLLGALFTALAIEKWNVHKRLALRVLLLIGVQPRRLMLGFMLVTAFISMWIANTATTAMMTPIMEAVLKQLDIQSMKDDLDGIEENKDENDRHTSIPLLVNTTADPSGEKEDANFDLKGRNSKINKHDRIDDPFQARQDTRHRQLCKALSLCICYAANIGGTATLTGTAPQMVLAGQVAQVFPQGPTITFNYWFVYAFPQMVLFLFIAWLYLQTLFLGMQLKHFRSCFCLKKNSGTKSRELYNVLQKQYEELGPLSWAENSTIGMFIGLVILWFFRKPKFISGWGDLFNEGYITDGTAAIIIGFLLFLWPSECPAFFKKTNVKDSKGRQENRSIDINVIPVKHKTLLNWKDVETKFPWNVLFLLGAGFALAKACDKSGLSKSLSKELAGLNAIPPMAFVFIVCTAITFLTEITSNTATATIFLPILASLGQSVEMHPFYLMIPAACCATFAFMLPAATPPNAIVFSTGRLSIRDMAKAGFGMNIIGILVVTLGINTWGMAYYGLGKFPEWARVSTLTTAAPIAATTSIANATIGPTDAFVNLTTPS